MEGNVYGAYVTGAAGVQARLSLSPSVVTHYGFDLFGNTVGRFRSTATTPLSSEVYDSHGKAWVRQLTSTGMKPAPYDPISAFGQHGVQVEEEDRADAYLNLNGDMLDPETGLSFTAPTTTTRRQRTMQAIVGIARGGLISIYKGFS
ncbi:hypothetical protein EON81_28195, partial [bacterium]